YVWSDELARSAAENPSSSLGPRLPRSWRKLSERPFPGQLRLGLKTGLVGRTSSSRTRPPAPADRPARHPPPAASPARQETLPDARKTPRVPGARCGSDSAPRGLWVEARRSRPLGRRSTPRAGLTWQAVAQLAERRPRRAPWRS